MSVVTREPPSFENEKLYLMARLADDLAPNLSDRPQDRRQTVPMAWRTIQSLHPGSEIEAIAAARIAALSFVQLDLLRDTTQANLTPAMKLRYASAVTRLNRAICDSETALARRQKAEELRPAIEQAAQPDRINRASNAEAIEQAKVPAMYGEIDLIRALKRQEAMAMAAMAAEADKPTPSADPAVHGAATAAHPAPAAAPAHPTPATAAHPAPAGAPVQPAAASGPVPCEGAKPAQAATGAAAKSAPAANAASQSAPVDAAPGAMRFGHGTVTAAAGAAQVAGPRRQSAPATAVHRAAAQTSAAAVTPSMMARILAAYEDQHATFYPNAAAAEAPRAGNHRTIRSGAPGAGIQPPGAGSA